MVKAKSTQLTDEQIEKIVELAQVNVKKRNNKHKRRRHILGNLQRALISIVRCTHPEPISLQDEGFIEELSHDESPNDEIDDVEKEKESDEIMDEDYNDNEIEDFEDLSYLTNKQIIEKFDCKLKNFLNFFREINF